MKTHARHLALAAILAAAALAGCSTDKTPEPVGIGTGVHDLKRSPCACVEIPQRLPAGAALGVGAPA